MRQCNTWKVYCYLTTLLLWTNIEAAEEVNKEDSPAIEINIKEITIQCQEIYTDVIAPTEEEQTSLIEKCIEEKMEKLKIFGEEQG